MKGAGMKNFKATRRTGLIIAAMVFFFSLTTVGQASAGDASLKSLLSKNGLSMKIVKLDRTDGFVYGLSFKGPKKTIVIAPGFDRMFLVQADGHEAILQSDGTGKLQVIQATGDISLLLCYAKAVISFLQNLTTCTQNDYVCYFTALLTLYSDMTSCNTGITQ
jgi:hypothetical protein